MFIALTIIIILYFLSIILEITLIPVPSVASTYQLLFPIEETKNIITSNSLLYTVQNKNLFIKGIIIVIPYILSLLGYCWPLLLIISHALGWIKPFWNNHIYLIILGVFLLLFGRMITLSSALDIRSNNSQKGDDFDLKTKGIFKLSRNPIALGLHVGILGMNILFPSWIFLGLTIVYVLNIHFKIILEEDFLKQLFKEKYVQYFHQTKRYL